MSNVYCMYIRAGTRRNKHKCILDEYTFVDLSRMFSDVYQTPIVCIYMYVCVEMNINVFSRTLDEYTFIDPSRIFSDTLRMYIAYIYLSKCIQMYFLCTFRMNILS